MVDMTMEMKIMNKIDTLITKWQTKIDNLIVMDDYDGGAASVMSETLKDLKKLKKVLDISEKTGTLEV